MSTERIDILVSAQNTASAVAKEVTGDYRAMGSEIKNLSGSGSVFDSLASSVGGLGTVLAGGAIVAGIQKIGAAIFDLAEQSAQADRLRTSFSQLASGVGESSDQMLAALRKASAGTVADTDLILQANRANLLGVAQSTNDLVKLLEIAGARGKATGRSLKDAFEDITLGIGRESKLILDNLGFMVDVEAVQGAYAASIGKTADELSNLERKQAITNELFAQSKDLIDANKTSGGDLASSFERMDASIQNAKVALGALFAPAVAVIADKLANAVSAVTTEMQESGTTKGLQSDLESLIATRNKLATGESIEIAGFGQLNSNRLSINAINEAIAETRQRILEAAEASNNFKLANPEDFSSPTAAVNPLVASLTGAPALVEEVAQSVRKLNIVPVDQLVGNINDLKGSFEDLDKAQKSIQNTITSSAVKASSVIGDDRAFALAGQQIEEFDKKLKELTSQALSGEIDPGEFLFKLQALPGQATEIFSQVQAAAKDGGEKLRAELANLVNLEDVFRSGGNSQAADIIAGQIKELTSVLDIVSPAAQRASTGLGALGNAAVTADSQLASIVTNAGGAGSAAATLGTDAGNAATDVYALNAALAGAPPALAAAGSAMIAAGMDASTAAAMVSGLTAEFNQLAGAQAGARRAIIQRAAGVADIVGPQKALALANQEIAKSEAAYKGLQDGLLAAGDGSTQFEFDLALLGTTTTSTFDEIEEADRKAKQLANQGLKAASSAANDAEKSFDSLKGKVAGVLSGALSLDVGVDTEKILGRDDAINEDARRLADVAVKGFDSPWAQYLAEKFPDTIGAAFEGADPKKAAAQLLRDFEDGLRPELLDKEKAKERVRRALVGEQNMASLAQEIAAELSAEFGGSINLGKIQAIADTTLGVDGAEADQLAQTLSGAASGVQSQLAGLGGSVKSGILAALEGIGEAVTGALDKQFRSEGSLKTMREAGGINGEAWGSGFLSKVGDNVPPKLIELLSVLVTPGVEAILNRNQTLQGAN